ncbi:hypothetical protein FRC00_001745, partial [Tulasnella sp. 408]
MQGQSVTDGLPPFRQESHQFSLMQLGLETGYKHQLRVHLAQALGCPILGDIKYGGSAISGGASTSLALHCRTISLL